MIGWPPTDASISEITPMGGEGVGDTLSYGMRHVKEDGYAQPGDREAESVRHTETGGKARRTHSKQFVLI